MKAILTRHKQFNDIITGHFELFEESGISIFKCVTLEIGDNQNKHSISCIPKGSFYVKKTYSKKFKNCFAVLNVPNRDAILIHVGNFKKDTHGCILVGNQININQHSLENWISGSRVTLNELLMITNKNFELTIK